MSEVRVTVLAGDAPTALGLLAVVRSEQAVRVVLLGVDEEAARHVAWPAVVGEVLVAPRLSPGAPTDALAPAVQAQVSDCPLVVTDSGQRARDLAGMLVAAEGRRAIWAVDALEVDTAGDGEAHRVVLGGSHRLVHRLDGAVPTVVLARPGRPAAVEQPGRPAVRTVEAEPAPSALSVTVAGAADDGAVDLGSADVVVGVGRGIGGAEHMPLFAELAGALGAALGASRAAVDEGWAPFGAQVGQTGRTVAPRLYLAFGISGAIQHLAGMRGSQCVVAVNTDPDAPLCRLADLVVEADAVAVAEALLRGIRPDGARRVSQQAGQQVPERR